MRRKPIVWVSGPDKGGTAAWLATCIAVRRSGGKPVRVTAGTYEKIRRKTPDHEPDALIIGGGADIDPMRYEDLITDLKNIRTSPDMNEPKGQRWITLVLAPLFGLLRKAFSTGVIKLDLIRDNLEWQLLQDAAGRNIPILGICRGAQLLNVYHSGTLYRDLSTYYREEPKITTIYPRKKVLVEQGSRLFNILGAEVIRVNSLHNQAVKQTGKGIRVVAREPGGVIQAIEHHGYAFMTGVQWHPEYLPQVSTQRRLFDELVRCAILHRDAGA